MFSAITTADKKSHRAITIGLSLSLFLAIGTGSLNIAATAQGLGPDQDSLLPPEVVPIEPAVAQASQYPGAAASAVAPGAQVPGMAGTAPVANAPAAPETQSAQDFRKSAFNSLYGQGVLPTQQAPNLQAMNGQMGQMAQPGMNGMPGTPATPGQGYNATAMNNQTAGAMQTQTLTGQAIQPAPKTQNTGVGKVTHAAALVTNLGGLSVMGAAMSGNPYSFFQVGLMGAGLMNYGLRGGSF